MANFDLYAPKLKQYEGGFVNDPDDRGGATMCGVTLNTYRAAFGQSKTVEDLKNISSGEWRYIMKGLYWDKCKADQIGNQSVAEIFADWVVNSGVAAIKKVQTLFGLENDGIVGPKTLAAINANPLISFDRIKSARKSFYYKLAFTTPAYAKFLKGWMSRVNSFKFKKQTDINTL